MEDLKEIAVCPQCANPLIGTLMIRGAEWFCLKCKWAGGIFDENTVDSTPELLAKLAADELEVQKHGSHIYCMGGGLRKTDCPQCQPHGTRHQDHLTAEEKELQTAALKALGFTK